MKRNNLLKGASLLIAVSIFSMFFAPFVSSDIIQPFTRWGSAYDSGGTELDAQDIYAWINGTMYGIDITGTGANVGLYQIDCCGDSANPQTTPDGIKIGGYNGDPIQYSWGNLTNPGDSFFIETDVWMVGDFNNGDLNETPASPTLLKINNISTNSGLGINFIGIYDPTGTATLTDYSLRIGTAAPQSILVGDIISIINLIIYIDMAGFAGFGNNQAISLIHTATGYYVDRVEYGAIASEPENTKPFDYGPVDDNALNPPVGGEIYRQNGPGVDTNNHGVDFGTQAVWFPSPSPTATITNVLPPSPTNVNTPDFTYDHTNGPATVDFYYYTTGPWLLFGTDNTIEGPPGTWTSPVLADGTYYFAAVANGGTPADPVPSVAPPGGDEEWGPYLIAATNYTINLHIGWNLISLPLIQSDENLGVALDNITGKWDYIQAYDTLDPDHWKTNATFKPDQLNDLKSLNHSIGFWINIIEANVNLTVYGLIPLYTEIPLYAGWNLVGYPSLTPRSVSLALAGTGYDGVEGFNATDLYRLNQLPGTYMMSPGEGYWIHVPADTNWIIDW